MNVFHLQLVEGEGLGEGDGESVSQEPRVDGDHSPSLPHYNYHYLLATHRCILVSDCILTHDGEEHLASDADVCDHAARRGAAVMLHHGAAGGSGDRGAGAVCR